MPDQLDPIILAIAAFMLGGIASLASTLRSKAELTVRVVLGFTLSGAATAMAVAMLLYKFLQDNTWCLLGVSVIVGLVNAKILNVVNAILQGTGINVKIDIQEPDGETKP